MARVANTNVVVTKELALMVLTAMEPAYVIRIGPAPIVPLQILPFSSKPNLSLMVCFLPCDFVSDIYGLLSGRTFTITFDIDTSYGGQPANVSFPCSTLLDTVTMAYLDPSASCLWLSRKNLSVSIAGSAVIRVGNPVVLKNGTIFANPGSVSAAVGNQPLLPPANPTVPTLALNGPTLVGSCDSITITATLQGAFGIPTLNVWTVTATTTNTSAVVAYLSSYTQLLPNIPDALLVPGSTYTFTLNVTNLFGTSAKSSITVTKSLYAVPTISIAGSSAISTYAPQSLTLQGSVVISTTSGCQPTSALVWAWRVVRVDTEEVVPLAANVVNKKNLVIPAGTLKPGTNYTVTLFGSYPALPGNLSNSATATIYVQRSEVIAAIAGGNIKTSSITQPLVVNATNSFDPDASTSSTLNFTWVCVSDAGSQCKDEDGRALTLPNTPTLVFPAQTLAENVTYTFTLIVSTIDGRSTTTSVKVSMVKNTPPSVSISKPDSLMVGSSQQLSLTGSVTPSTNVTYLWTETTGQLDLNNRNNLLTSRNNINLVIKPNVLTPGSKYSFVLEATNANGTGIAGVDIAVSPLPHGGICSVSPTSGTVVTTPFAISCNGWEDDSPLAYTFSYMLSGTEVILRSQAATSLSTSLPLPSGGSNAVPIIVKITNKYNATTVTTFNATVTLPASNGSSNTAFVQSAFDQVTADLNQYGDPDASIQSLVALSSVLQAPSSGSGDAQAVVLSQKIFTLFAGVASSLTDASGSVEQQAGNVAILSSSSSEWDDDSKKLLANVLYDYSSSSGSASTQALGGLLTGLSNIFTTDLAPNSAEGDNSTRRTRVYIRGNFRRDAAGQQNSSLGNNPELYTKLRDSVSHITNNVLGSMVCGQDNTDINTANIQLTAGKVPRENLQNASFDVSGMSTSFPFNSSSFGDIDCMDTKIAVQPIDLYHDSSTDFVSHIASVTVGAGGSDFNVHNLSEPIVMVFPIYNYTTNCNATSNCSQTCQFLNTTSNKWQSDGCTVFSSNLTHVVCHCDHLTSFSVQFKSSLKPLEDAGRLISHPSFSNLKDRPAPIIFIACIFAVYIAAMATAIRYDRKRGFYDTEVPIPDMPPQYATNSVNGKQYESARTRTNSMPIYSPNFYSPPAAQPATLTPEMSVPTICITPEDDENPDGAPNNNNNITTTSTTTTGRISPTHPAIASIRLAEDNLNDSSDSLNRSSDAMLGGGSLRSNGSDSVRSTGSLGSVGPRMGRRSMRGSVRRKSIVMKEEQEKIEKEAHLQKVASGEHAKQLQEKDFSASLEAVDEVYGVADQKPMYQTREERKRGINSVSYLFSLIFYSTLSKWQEFKLDVSLRLKTNHRYVSTKIIPSPFSRTFLLYMTVFSSVSFSEKLAIHSHAQEELQYCSTWSSRALPAMPFSTTPNTQMNTFPLVKRSSSLSGVLF